MRHIFGLAQDAERAEFSLQHIGQPLLQSWYGDPCLRLQQRPVHNSDIVTESLPALPRGRTGCAVRWAYFHLIVAVAFSRPYTPYTTHYCQWRTNFSMLSISRYQYVRFSFSWRSQRYWLANLGASYEVRCLDMSAVTDMVLGGARG